ncbi:chemotaxis protein CheA [Phenylobacterium sp.]|uniref:chemotaxis protein CheA n=1 Tax=Phenylobacterium sp. TaxID=1871053 RepID=UPI0035AE9294
MDPLESIKATFFQECDELLTDAEQGLLAMEAGDYDSETINAVFRAVHSVKGGAGAFGLEDLIRFAHVFETVMDELRSGNMVFTDDVAKILLRASDVLADHVQAARTGGSVEESRSAPILAELQSLIGDEGMLDDGDGGLDGGEIDFTPVTLAIEDEPAAEAAAPAAEEAPATNAWKIVFKPRTEMYAKANEAGLVLRELGRLGAMQVELDQSELPRLDQLSAEHAYLSWTIRLETAADETAIREVFEFVEDDCDLSVEREGGPAAADLDLAAILSKAQQDTDEPAADAAQEPEAESAEAVAEAAEAAAGLDVAALIARAQAAGPVVEAPPPAAPAQASSPAPAPKKPAAAPAPAAAGASSAPPPQTTIRVDLDRVDRLINAVGELVIQQAMLSQRVIESGLARSSAISLGLEDLELLTREIQDSVMAIRAQPVKSVFQRMPRLVREVADMTNKRARLVMEGENTEVDKTVIERLSDPITHMLRNAIDHGLETPEEREAAGKPPEGTVKLAALHRGGRIVIEVSDDGKGINRQRVRGIAIDKGLIAEDAILTDDEVDNLIFLPGFSTAETVSDISGRGVGMDVVKRSIQALGGRISISSEPGKGSKFTMSLPLTLAVLDGMVLSASEQTLVAPLSNIVESLTPRSEDVHYIGGKDAVIRIRDTFVPLIDVGVSLGYRDAAIDPPTGVAILVESEGGGKAALLVEAIQGQRQVVIKSLEANYQQVPGVAAATILGDGRVALILDVDALVSNNRRKAGRPEKRMAAA